MKKLLFLAVCLLIATAFAEQKAASINASRQKPIVSVSVKIDSLATKIEYLNKIRNNEK